MTGFCLSARGLGKSFGQTRALSLVDLEVKAGQIHALCGENGAGKSTLIRILCGLHPHGSYQGELLVDGQVARFGSIRDAERVGIGVIDQELALVPELTVGENLLLGREPTRFGLIDTLAQSKRARALGARLNLDLDPEARLANLGIGQRQLVEILRTLGRDVRFLILDEPTAALSEREVSELLLLLRQLKEQQMACLYVSHRLDEVFAIADVIHVLRDGRRVLTRPREQVDREEVVAAMVGRTVEDYYPKRVANPGECLLRVEELSVEPPADGLALERISFQVRSGEVLGIGGLLGAGRTELLHHLFAGWGRRVEGQVWLLGATYDHPCPAESIARGMMLVTEDRKGSGLLLEESVRFNLSLSSLPAITHLGLIDSDLEQRRSRDSCERLRIRARDAEDRVGELSGGNQQKVVLGRALLALPQVVLLDEPTRGIDVGAKVEVYQLINELTAAGRAVVMVSSELPELLAMSDRILMLGQGRPGGLFDRAQATAESLLEAALRATERTQVLDEGRG